MGFLEWAKAFFERVAPEALRHLDPAPPTPGDYCALEQERLDLELRCEAYRLILLNKGETDESLRRKVALYRGAKMRAA